jgi:hypothetical protein
MNCEQIEVWISASQDSELDPRRQRQVDDHLAMCSGCRELAAEWTALESTLRAGLVRLDAPETLHTRVMRQIPEPAAIGRRGSWTPGNWFSFGLVPAGAAAAWMLLVGHPVTSRQPARPSDPPRVASTVPDPTLNPAESIGTQVSVVKKPPSTDKPASSGNTTGGLEKPTLSTKTTPSARPGGTNNGSRPKYDPIRGLRQLRQRRRNYRMVQNPPHHRRHWRRNFARDESLRMVKDGRPPVPVQPPTTNERPLRTARLPRVTIVDYVLPQVPTPTTVADGGAETQFVLRSAQPQQVAQAGYEF